MKRTRVAALLLALCLFCTAFAGCGKSDEQVSATVRIFNILGDEAENEVYSQLLKDFSSKNERIYIKDTGSKRADAFKLGATMASTYASSDAPHIVYYYSGTGIEQLEGCFISVDEIRQYYPDYAKNVSDEAIKSLASGDISFGVPVMGEWSGLLINNELLGQYGLDEPDSWELLLQSVVELKDSGVLPIANSPGDSEILLEALVRGYGGEAALGQGLIRDSQALSGAWTQAFSAYLSLCETGAFPAAQISEEAAAFLSDGDAAISEADAAQLFNSGAAAMIFVDRATINKITIDDKCSLLCIPVPDDAPFGEALGGFDAGVYITAKAFANLDLRDTVIALAEYLISEQAQLGFAQLGYMPSASTLSLQSESTVLRDMLILCEDTRSYAKSSRTSAESAKWSELERIAAELSYGIITPSQAALLFSDPDITLEELLAPVVSESDAPVSGSDAQPE